MLIALLHRVAPTPRTTFLRLVWLLVILAGVAPFTGHYEVVFRLAPIMLGLYTGWTLRAADEQERKRREPC